MTAGSGLFDGVFGRGAVAAAVDDQAWLRAMLDAEAALATAEARARVIPARDAERIRAVCRVGAFDVAAIGRAAAEGGNPVIPLVTALRASVGAAAAKSVHRGATSQDCPCWGIYAALPRRPRRWRRRTARHRWRGGR